MSPYRGSSEDRYIKPRESSQSALFLKRLNDGLRKDSNSKHLVILLFLLQSYALRTLYNGNYDLAVATAFPTLFLPYTWSYWDHYPTILGIPFYYILPFQGHTYPYPKWSAQYGKMISGPARDGYTNCFYTIPLYLALWYTFVAMFFPEDVTFLVLVAVLLVSRPEYWFSEPKIGTRKRSALHASNGMMYRLRWQVIVGASTWLVWITAQAYMYAEVELEQAHPSQLVAIEQGPALALTCVLVIKVINTWKGIRGLRSDLIYEPYEEYWNDSTTEQEIVIWEMLAQKEHEKRQRRRREGRSSGYGIKERNRAQAFRPEDWQHEDLYEEESPEPEALYRGSESGEEDIGAADGGGNDVPAPALDPPLAGAPPAVAVGGSIPGHPLPAPVAPIGFRPYRDPAASRPNRPPAKTAAERKSAREQHALKLREAFPRNPALARKFIERQVQGLEPEKEAKRRERLGEPHAHVIQDRIAYQRFKKVRRPDNSVALTVPYNDNPDPAAPKYVSIIEDSLARNPDDDVDSDVSFSTDVYEADDRYPGDTIPRRAWRECLVDIFGTVDMFFDRTKRSAKNVFLLLAQGLAAAVLIRSVVEYAGHDQYGFDIASGPVRKVARVLGQVYQGPSGVSCE
ncbi:uncharacterized protein N0V89_007228 [Didymosphaeria variabile]|uniref:Uncharacterized protein n=1 Tax=Didymosphaeria variabile TaxID=1932322 RepID=A0A9W8XJ17_9PLEO|nr:uncharacterized protein N0V89_007228 [Didymosphaeria variabile]KAJ4351884.1 hypothetical protein N0V89_007228 [Didymosphaeria variabile]